MRKSIILAAAALALGAGVAASQPKKDIGYDSHANAFGQLDTAVAKAAADDKLLLLISGGDWCKWCHYLAAFLERDVLRSQVRDDVVERHGGDQAEIS